MDAANADDGMMELEFTEDDVAYYIVDENDEEVGVALYDEEGNEVEYYYADDAGEWEAAAEDAAAQDAADGEPFAEEAFEIEVSEDDIAYYIVDEDGNELGFALTEADGTETEYYYEGVNGADYVDADAAGGASAAAVAAGAAAAAAADDAVAAGPKKSKPIAKRAGEEVGKLAAKANALKGDEPIAKRAGEGVGKFAAQATATAKGTAKKIKDTATGKPKTDEDDEDLGFGLTSSGVKQAAGEFTALAKEGAQAAAELRGVYDDIMGDLDFLRPSSRSGSKRS